jgi:sulfur carrier protein|tara:strand:+ start:696 stop:896 length:201 start_codon:yes stop_codon:yes gene_type:complete
MNIYVNNQNIEVAQEITISQLLDIQKVKTTYIAIEINNEIIPKSKYLNHIIHDGDKIEIITAVGGG